MLDSRFEKEFHSLRALRRRLTVALLAIEQLCRKVCALPPAKRLCAFATDALKGMRGEVATLEARLLDREKRDTAGADRAASADHAGQE
ncbi:MAG: hypothetical protein M3Y58_22995 [Chloroflexota bacterium]|nr:hypothetical protein [Chloroflexota bacterium]